MTDLRSPEAKARDKWLESKEGQTCCEGTANGQYLQNRLERAFSAGLDAGVEISQHAKTYKDLAHDCAGESVSQTMIQQFRKMIRGFLQQHPEVGIELVPIEFPVEHAININPSICSECKRWDYKRCPKCGGDNTFQRRGVHFEHERYCGKCNNSYDPQEEYEKHKQSTQCQSHDRKERLWKGVAR